MDYTLEAPMLHRDLHRLGVKVHPQTMLEKIEPASATPTTSGTRRTRSASRSTRWCSSTARISDDELYRELKSDRARLEAEGIEALYVIGDAAAPRMIVDSIFDGHRLAREIDSPHPEMPLPFIRERRLWGDTANGDYRSQLLNTADVALARGRRRGEDRRRGEVRWRRSTTSSSSSTTAPRSIPTTWSGS